jgi:hypothetical protein
MRAARQWRAISDHETSDADCEHEVCRRSEGAGLGSPERRQGVPGGECVRGGRHSMDLRHDIGIVQSVQVPSRAEAGDRDSRLPVLEGNASVALHRARAARAEIQREARGGLATRLHAGRERSFGNRPERYAPGMTEKRSGPTWGPPPWFRMLRCSRSTSSSHGPPMSEGSCGWREFLWAPPNVAPESAKGGAFPGQERGRRPNHP